MSAEAPSDWKWQVCDEMEKFAAEAFPNSSHANEILMQDVGQAHLVADAVRPLFPTVNIAGGDAETAKGIGGMIGHYESLLESLAHSVEFFTALKTANDALVDTRDKIDAILSEYSPEAVKGPETGVIHLLAAFTVPELCACARNNLRAFREKITWVMEVVFAQSMKERKEFLAGYGAARACSTIGANGIPTDSNKEASLAAVLRPFAMKLGLTTSDFQDVVEHYAQARITGNPERFAKYLQRHKAPLRGKGRPSKKSAKVAKRKRGKSDKN